MTTGGVDPVVGFILPTPDEIVSSINTSILGSTNPNLDLAPNQPMGQVIGAFAAQLALAWQALQTAYNGFNPDAAEGFLLDALSALTGTLRPQATPSTVVCQMVLAANTTVPAGSLINVSGSPATTFALQVDVIGTTAGTYLGTFASTALGPVAANASTLTVITNPVSGWTSVTNPANATPGTNIADDTQLRSVRTAELDAGGSGTPDALQAAMSEIAGVLQCYVLENRTNATDVNGLPPHSFEVIIYDSPTSPVSDSLIAQTIWNNKPAGVRATGAVTDGIAFDSQGNLHNIPFSRVTVLTLYANLSIVTNANFPANGIVAVKNAIATWAAANLGVGAEVVALAIKAAALTVAGVVDVPLLQMDLTASPTDTGNITISQFQIVSVVQSNILVNGT